MISYLRGKSAHKGEVEGCPVGIIGGKSEHYKLSCSGHHGGCHGVPLRENSGENLCLV